ncbi:hypothetical protein, partial [Salmonella sp. s29873]|uniref:hypothetical protein n=1 Tax=Salmonella sp. s29873 TaxID=3159634 RepID=UPI00397F09BB
AQSTLLGGQNRREQNRPEHTRRNQKPSGESVDLTFGGGGGGGCRYAPFIKDNNSKQASERTNQQKTPKKQEQKKNKTEALLHGRLSTSRPFRLPLQLP